jgi:AraC-like DNA-binding protein
MVSHEVVTPDTGSFFRALRWGAPTLKPYDHDHPEWELCAVIAGQGQQRVGPVLRPFRTGEVFLFGPGLEHCSWAPDAVDGPHDRVVMLMPAEPRGIAWLDLPELAACKELFAAGRRGLVLAPEHSAPVIAAASRVPGSSGSARLGALLACLQCLAEAPYQAILPYATAEPAAPGHELAAGLRTWLAAHAGRHISLAEAARQAGMHPQSFARFFRRETGHSLVGYLSHLRVDHACDLLGSTDQAVTDIALQVGFGSLAQFNRTFAKLRRMSPSAYRRRQRPGRAAD